MHILTQLTDDAVLRLALAESAKLVPYVTSSRKAIKIYLKVLLSTMSHVMWY